MTFPLIDFTTFGDVPNPNGFPTSMVAASQGINSPNDKITFPVNQRMTYEDYEAYWASHKAEWQTYNDQQAVIAAAAAAAADLAAREAAKPDYVALRDQAAAAFNANVTYLAIASPTNAQVAAQVRALTQQNQKLIKACEQLVRAAI